MMALAAYTNLGLVHVMHEEKGFFGNERNDHYLLACPIKCINIILNSNRNRIFIIKRYYIQYTRGSDNEQFRKHIY